jgi:hypothetical protein
MSGLEWTFVAIGAVEVVYFGYIVIKVAGERRGRRTDEHTTGRW